MWKTFNWDPRELLTVWLNSTGLDRPNGLTHYKAASRVYASEAGGENYSWDISPTVIFEIGVPPQKWSGSYMPIKSKHRHILGIHPRVYTKHRENMDSLFSRCPCGADKINKHFSLQVSVLWFNKKPITRCLGWVWSVTFSFTLTQLSFPHNVPSCLHKVAMIAISNPYGQQLQLLPYLSRIYSGCDPEISPHPTFIFDVQLGS